MNVCFGLWMWKKSIDLAVDFLLSSIEQILEVAAHLFKNIAPHQWLACTLSWDQRISDSYIDQLCKFQFQTCAANPKAIKMAEWFTQYSTSRWSIQCWGMDSEKWFNKSPFNTAQIIIGLISRLSIYRNFQIFGFSFIGFKLDCKIFESEIFLNWARQHSFLPAYYSRIALAAPTIYRNK